MATTATTSLSCCCSFNMRGSTHQPKHPTPPSSLSATSASSTKPKSFHRFPSKLSFSSSPNPCFPCFSSRFKKTPSSTPVLASAKPGPLKIMISGAPASGKGTQCELITKKYGLVHVAAGDLLRAEIASGSENGRRAKEFMEKGQLVPDEIVVTMVKDRLLRPDAEENGWLLDGYPRSLSQATALQKFGFRPDLFILLDVNEEILLERVVGRRLDPVTGRIYHLKYSPPETEEIAARLTQRFDDTEEKVKLRLRTHRENVEAVLSMFEDVTFKVNGNVAKEEVFAQIDCALRKLLDDREATSMSLAA